ncbi:MAG TPA: FUSC family protein [Kofleriaceae bacterium]
MSPRLAALLPDLVKGVRAAIATVVPFFLARALDRPELAWVALGGWLASLADPGGAGRTRAIALVAFLLSGTSAVLLGTLAAPSPIASVIVVAAIVFGASLARVLGGAAAAMGTMISIAAAIAAEATRSPPLVAAGWFALGAVWAIALASIVWPVWPHMPLRGPTARVYDELAQYVDAIAELARRGERDPAAWSAVARERQRPVRAALETASTAMVELRARRFGVSAVGANTRTLLGEAEAEFFKLIGYADELEGRPATDGDLAALTELAASYRETRDQLLTRRAGTWRPDSAPTAPSRLARELVVTSRLVVDVSRDLDVLPTAEASHLATPHVVHPNATAARDALSWRSPAFHHAVRVTLTVIAALLVGRFASPKHAQWVSITALAVLQPYLGPTLVRVGERVVGTIAGCMIAIGLIMTFASPAATAAAMFPLAVIAVVTRPRSYRLFVLFLTPVFLLVADRGSPTFETAFVRMLDVAIGGAIALVASIIRPSWERARLPDAVCDVLDAVGAYVTTAFAGADRAQLAAARRKVGIALETAEASLERMLAEPRRLQHGAADAVMLLTYTRRIAAALTALGESHRHVELAPELRAYVLAELAAAKQFVATGERTPAREPPAGVDPALARLVHHAELVGRVATSHMLAA